MTHRQARRKLGTRTSRRVGTGRVRPGKRRPNNAAAVRAILKEAGRG